MLKAHLTAPILLFLGIGLPSADSIPKNLSFWQVHLPVDRGPHWVAVADLNHDQSPDLLVANADAGTLSVLLGNGKGEFHNAPGSPNPAGHLPNDLAIADMNGDGNLDVVIANHQAPYITILLGDGTGRLAPASGSPFDVHSNPHPHGVVAGDFYGNVRPAIVTDSWADNQIELLNGNGKGGLQLPGRFFPVGHRPYERLRSADFNHDGHPDIVTTNLDDGTVSILLGDGKGAFTSAPRSPFPAGAKPWQVFTGDLDGDGKEDLAIIPYQRDIASPTQNVVTVLLGSGDGSFSPRPGPPLSLGACRGADSISAGNLTNGRTSIVVGCAQSRELVIFTQDSAGRYSRSSIPSIGGWGGLAVAKLTGDSRSEIITADNDSGTITIYFPR